MKSSKVTFENGLKYQPATPGIIIIDETTSKFAFTSS